ncbi:MAG: NDP-sugar synthase [Actinomycetota bacterium]|nr:NDP-sugar synthase [Actinomycetota bacterium]
MSAAEAVLLVGGQGTRLRPLTSATAKPMLPTAGVPFLTHQLVRLREAGVRRVVLATSYRAETFSGHFGDGAHLGLDLDYAVEDEPLGTGGAIRNVADRLRSDADEPVVILNGDILSDHDLAEQVALHREEGAEVTLHLVTVPDPRAFGCVPTDEQGRVTAFLEKLPDPVTDQINAGCYVFRRAAIDAIPPGRPVSVERETFPELVRAGQLVLGFVQTSYWLDVGTPAAYVRASCDLVRGILPSAGLPGPAGDQLALPGADVADGATVRGGTAVGSGAVVGPGAWVEGSVVMDGAVIEPGARVVDSAVGVGAVVGRGTVLDGVVVGDGAHTGERNELGQGARIWTAARLPDTSIRFSPDV